MLLQRVHALFLVQVEADALLYHMVNLNQQHKLSTQNHPFVEWYRVVHSTHTILM